MASTHSWELRLVLPRYKLFIKGASVWFAKSVNGAVNVWNPICQVSGKSGVGSTMSAKHGRTRGEGHGGRASSGIDAAELAGGNYLIGAEAGSILGYRMDDLLTAEDIERRPVTDRYASDRASSLWTFRKGTWIILG
jgi:hypothetical protein